MQATSNTQSGCQIHREYELDNNTCQFIGRIIKLLQSKGYNKIVSCCQFGINRSQTFAALLKQVIEREQIEDIIIETMSSIGVIPEPYGVSLSDFESEQTVRSCKTMKQVLGYDRQTTLNIKLARKIGITNFKTYMYGNAADKPTIQKISDTWDSYSSECSDDKIVFMDFSKCKGFPEWLRNKFSKSIVLAQVIDDKIATCPGAMECDEPCYGCIAEQANIFVDIFGKLDGWLSILHDIGLSDQDIESLRHAEVQQSHGVTETTETVVSQENDDHPKVEIVDLPLVVETEDNIAQPQPPTLTTRILSWMPNLFFISFGMLFPFLNISYF